MHAHLAALTPVGRAPERYVGHGVLNIRDMGVKTAFLNPDCGFGTFSNRPMNTREIAFAKVAAMAAAARDLRGRL